MLIETSGLSKEEVEEIVADHCSSFGTVKKVAVRTARPESSVQPFALVYMQTLDQAAELAAAFGRKPIGFVAVIPLDLPVQSPAFSAGVQPRGDSSIAAFK